MSRNRLVLALALACAAPAAIAASPVEPELISRPSAAVTSLPAGLSRLGNGAVAYRPERLAPGAAPLVVILHGRGGPSSQLFAEFKSEADAKGLILLAPKSLDVTWDLIIDAGRYGGGRPREGESLRFGRDVARIDSALAETFAKAAIDPQRIVLAGFSDGASYALSLGMANPTLFRGILAMSPGLMVAPDEADDSQRLFIAHGRSDRAIPVNVSRDGLARALAEAGMNVRFRQFNGGHEVDRKALREGLDFALGTAE
jgi:predicted esterase